MMNFFPFVTIYSPCNNLISIFEKICYMEIKNIFFAPQCERPHNIQYGEPRDVKNRGFTANLDKRQAAELPQTKETHQWKV